MMTLIQDYGADLLRAIGLHTIYVLISVVIGFAAGLVFLPYIFIPLLAFGKETYQGVPVKAAPYQNNPYQQGGYSQQPQQFQYAAPPQQPQQYAAPQQPAPQQPETETRTSAFCPRCGVKSSGEKFCQNCGTPLR